MDDKIVKVAQKFLDSITFTLKTASVSEANESIKEDSIINEPQSTLKCFSLSNKCFVCRSNKEEERLEHWRNFTWRRT